MHKIVNNFKLIKHLNFISNYNKIKMTQPIEDNRLEVFRRVCDEIGEENSYLKKACILKEFFKKGSDKKGFNGDTLLWLQMLIPSATQRVYNLQNKQMVKLFSRLFACDAQEMHLDLEQEGDVSETLRKFFESSKKLKPQKTSTIYLQDVEEFLIKLEQKTKEDEQTDLLRQICKCTTSMDLRTIIRLIKQDLRINAGARHILDGLGPFAYVAYQSSRDLAAVVRQFGPKSGTQSAADTSDEKKSTKKGNNKVGQVQVMTPISPMLANACKSVEEAFKKSPGGLYSEIKYDGERVQIHKKGNEFKFFSRNLKPVMEHKIKRFKEFIPKAFPGSGDMILDSEIILVDTKTGELLPFGSLGTHKKKEYVNAEVCLFVFDCILYNGEDLTNKHFSERREILEENIKLVKNYVQLSESHFLKTKNELSLMTAKVLKANLEGVVLKSPTSTYQPGKRGWLKVKKDYLFGGKMADTADLVVLGGWFGSGKKGGILSIFLMGCYDLRDRLWKTVTKVHSGLDDATNEEMHEKLMALMKRCDTTNLPTWLLCKKSLAPDYIAKVPENMPVWEITGAEFTKSEAHTASGISIRFPRITRLRDDKSAEQANDLEYLEKMFEASKKDVNVDLLIKDCKDEEPNDDVMEIEGKINLKLSPTKMKNIEKGETASSSKKLKREISDEHDDNDDDDDDGDIREAKVNNKKQKMDKITPKKENKGKVTHKQLTLDFSFAKLKKKDEVKVETKNGDDNDNDIIMATKNGAQEKVEEAETSFTKESDIFKNITAYFTDDVKDAQLLKDFKVNGGKVTTVGKKATVIFHKATTGANVDLNYYRENYAKTGRHLSIDWLKTSIAAKKCQPYPDYAVALKSD